MLRVLVIDDEAAQRFLFTTLLERTGYNAVAASGGKEALDLLAKDPDFDAILTDMAMPGLHGVDLLQELGRVHPKIPVIPMSVRRAEDWDIAPHDEPLYLLKPFDRTQLASTLRRAIGPSRFAGPMTA
jgi:CheY-like chemotaxis protein